MHRSEDFKFVGKLIPLTQAMPNRRKGMTFWQIQGRTFHFEIEGNLGVYKAIVKARAEGLTMRAWIREDGLLMGIKGRT